MAETKISKELRLFLKLVSFFKKIRHQAKEEQAHFFLVNDLYHLVPYKQCVVWMYEGGKVVLKNASGQVDVSQRSPYAQFISKHIMNTVKHARLNDNKAVHDFFEEESFCRTKIYTISDYNHYDPNDVKEWVSPHSVCLYLRGGSGLIGGIWLERNEPFGNIELAMLDDIGDAYADKMQNLKKKRAFFKKTGRKGGHIKKILIAALLILCLLPIRNSMTVGVEVVSEDVSAVSVPYNGLVKDVIVSPNQQVKKGDVLFALDKVVLQNEYNLALQELNTARRKLEKTQREAFADPLKKSDLKILQEQISLKEIEVEFAYKKLQLSEVRAGDDGIILFSDKNDLLGKPIQAGQQVMTLADPRKIELLLRIPTEGMIKIDRDVPIKFFLNIAPLKSHAASLQTVSYKPEKNANGVFGYSARASIDDIYKIERIGLTGTGKIYGSRTILIAHLLRRPFISLRNFLKI